MRAKIISDGTDHGTRVLTEAGEPIHGITRVGFVAQVDDIARADISLAFVEIEAEAEVRAYVGTREVRRIEYADGSVEEYPA